MDFLISMTMELWNSLAPTTWLLLLGLLVSYTLHQKDAAVNSTIQIAAPAL